MECPVCTQEIRATDLVCPHCTPPVSDTSERPTLHRPGAPELAPGSLFAGRYTILAGAHAGGMGVVYRTRDNQLQETVALKLIRPDRAASQRYAERFRREVRLARQIVHPNVGRVHDIGEFDGTLYLSMQWIEGESLAQLLRKAGRLELDRALEFAAKICGALAAAHEAGVVHRDLKPGNVMIDEKGEVFVVDFGLALEVEPGSGTRPSLVGGTPQYMAPEQARGDRVDPRADLYALGVVVREMVTGAVPGATANDAIRGPDAERRNAVRQLIEELVQEDPDRRPVSAAAVLARLRSLSWHQRRAFPLVPRLATAVLVGAAGVLVWHLLVPAPDPRDPLQDFVTSAETYRRRGLDYLIEEYGTREGLETAIRMFYRAVEKDSTDALAWAALGEAFWIRFDATNDETSRAEAEAAVSRARVLEPELAEARVANGRGLLAEGRHEEARHELEAAVAVSPRLDRAWEYLGRAYRGLGQYEAGLAALHRALELEPKSVQHLNYLGNFYLHFKEHEKAIAAYRQATELKPDDSMAWNNLGAAYLRLGDFERAAQSFEQLLETRADGDARTNLGNAYFFSGRYEAAVAEYRAATQLDPQRAVYWGNLGDGLLAAGRPGEAKPCFAEAVALTRREVAAKPMDASARRRLALWCARAGDAGCAVEECQAAAELAPEDGEVHFTNAIVYCVLGRPAEALPWLERAVKLGVTRAAIESEPALAPLHAMDEYRRIVELAG